MNPLTGEPFITVLTGAMLEKAEASESQYGGWQLTVTFTDEGSEIIQAYTASHLGEPMAIVLDGVVRSIPIIQAEISDTAVIQGNLEEAEVRHLAAVLDSGALPIPLIAASIEVIQ
jgi:preprotein translocase subunit SecD